jgi:glutamate--cysteine ligase
MASPSHDGPKAQPLRSRDDLFAIFHEAMKPAGSFRIGVEAEKFGVDATTGAPLPYEGPRSVLRVLEALVARHGWTPEPEVPGGPLIALTRSGASITLEPGAQLELSGAPLDNIHQICLELSSHLAELRDISDELNISWLGIGFHPIAKQEELSWVPKQRYGIMKRYLPTVGANGLDMMRRTSTVQANFDYPSEEQAMRMLRVALRASPVTTAMFANSPFYEGKRFGGKSYRAHVWLDVHKARQGLVRPVLEGKGGFEDYVEWALDAPMFLVKRGAKVLENTGQPFRAFLADGFEGERATFGDWETHLNTLFPEVRLKRTIEVRGADAQPASLSCALPALWTGLLYDARALDEAEKLTESYSYDELEAIRPDVARLGLGATLRGKPLALLAEHLCGVAMAGLERRGRLNRNGRDERVHLNKIAALVEKGRSPADLLLDGLGPEGTEQRRDLMTRARI